MSVDVEPLAQVDEPASRDVGRGGGQEQRRRRGGAAMRSCSHTGSTAATSAADACPVIREESSLRNPVMFDLERYKQTAGRLDDDVDYAAFRDEPLRPEILRCVRYMHDVE